MRLKKEEEEKEEVETGHRLVSADTTVLDAPSRYELLVPFTLENFLEPSRDRKHRNV